MRLVLDASACVELLTGTEQGRRVAEHLRAADTVHAPDLMVSEVLSALRGLVRGAAFSEIEASLAARDLARLDVELVSAIALTPRVWRLAQQHSTYDAHYLALAELLEGTLVTTDARLARGAASGVGTGVRVVCV